MIHLAVEQFHDDGDLVFLGEGCDAFQTNRAIRQALLVTHAFAVAGKANDGRRAELGHGGQRLRHELDNLVVVLHAVQPRGDAAGHAAHDGAGEPVLFERGEILHFEQFDGLQSNPLGGDTEFFERNLAVTPFADGVVDAALELRGDGGFRGSETMRQIGGDGGGSRSASDFAESGTTGELSSHDGILPRMDRDGH